MIEVTEQTADIEADPITSAEEMLALKDRVGRLKRGNTELIDALMAMVGQFFYSDNNSMGGVLTHSHMSAEENAIEVLLAAGFAEKVDGGYRLLWDKMQERRLKEGNVK
jgi:hypothetical protein